MKIGQKRSRRSGRILLPALLLLSSAAGTAGAGVTMRIMGDIPKCGCEWEAPHTQAIEKIVRPRLEELSKGEVDLQYFPATSGLGQKEVYEQMLLGAWEGAAITTAVLETYVPEIQIISLPYIWDSFDHIHRTLDGPLGRRLEDAAAKKGFRSLAWWHFPPRDLLCRDDLSVRQPSDLKGKKIRTMQSPVYVRTLKSYGAIPVPMAWGEVYLGLKQGVVDCQETSILPAYYMKHYEVTKTVVQIEEIYTMLVFVVSENWWRGLSARHRKAIRQAVKEGTDFARETDEQLYGKMLELWKEKGVKIVRPERDPFIRAARSTYPKYYEKVGRENIDLILRSGDKKRKKEARQ